MSKVARPVINAKIYKPQTDDNQCQTEVTMRKGNVGYMTQAWVWNEHETIFRDFFTQTDKSLLKNLIVDDFDQKYVQTVGSVEQTYGVLKSLSVEKLEVVTEDKHVQTIGI